MLNPADRSLLLECLRPPQGYQIDHAIGTSYSLDLLALLSAPLAFTFFDWEEEDGKVTTDPLALLEAIRRYARKITLFCQAGEIKLPPATQRLTAYLENSVVPVTAPKGGVFHPKVWLLRYESATGPPCFRCVILSRNLTMDRSWDTVVVLDGTVVDRRLAIAVNHPLGEFIEALPGLASRPIEEALRVKVQAMAQEVRRVQWVLPEGVGECRFWPIGLSGREQWPFHCDARRPVLVMSPFLTDNALARLTEQATSATLISRPDALAKLTPDTLKRFESVYAFVSDAEGDPDSPESSEDPTLSGLHAKVFVIDDGWNARLFLGSANATDAAFRNNVEFVVELVGAKKDLGIGALMAAPEGTQTGLINLLQKWIPADGLVSPEQALREALEDKLDQLKRIVAVVPLTVLVENNVAGAYRLTITSDAVAPALLGGTLRCWPITLRPERATEVRAGEAIRAVFDGLTLDALTGFVALEIKLSEQGITVARRFAVSAKHQGMPPDRLERLLASMLQNPEQLLRLLWLLLEAQGGLPGASDASAMLHSATPWAVAPREQYPIFERVLRALAVSPETLREIGRLIKDLSRTPEGARLLPPGLVTLWTAVCAAEPKAAS